MGVCCQKTRVTCGKKLRTSELLAALECKNLERLKQMKQEFTHTFVTSPVLEHAGINISPLTYAFCLGHSEVFIYLFQLGDNCGLLAQELSELGWTPIDFLCEKGYSRLLEFFIRENLLSWNSDQTGDDDEVSLFTNKCLNSRETPTLAPILRLCKAGHLQIIEELPQWFARRVPAEFSVHYTDDKTGNNAALYALKSGNLKLVQYLHEQCQVNFHVVNKRDEHALVVAAVSSKQHFGCSYHKVFEYLVEVVKVDVLHQHEEVLLILDNQTIVRYFEAQLRRCGVDLSKELVEKRFGIYSPTSTREPQTGLAAKPLEPALFDLSRISKADSLSYSGFLSR